MGSLKRINIQNNQDWAFIPAPLPSKWDPSTDIWPLLIEAREELARLDGIGRHMPNHELLLSPLQHREALRSSSLEGTFATPEQLFLYGIDPKEPKSSRDPVNDWREVFNYSRALRIGQKLLDEIPFSLRFISALHKTLLDGVRGNQKDPGNFRKSQVHIGSDRRFIPPPHTDALQCLYTLEEYLHQNNEIDPLVFCFMVHYQFETIHPFLDGNGRVGRLLLSLMIYELCDLINPWLYLSAYFDKYKDEYIDGLFRVSTSGDWSNWLSFCLRGTALQAKDAIIRFDKLVALRDKYKQICLDRGCSIRLTEIIDRLFTTPIITIPRVADMFSISYPTARADIHDLINTGILTESTTQKRPKAYFASEVMDYAYSEFPID